MQRKQQDTSESTSHAWNGLPWSPWIALEAPIATYKNYITTEPGLYRVRVTGCHRLAYLGETGRGLRQRTRALAGHTYRGREHPPWNDPHTAAPGLWAWRIEDGLDYELSVTPLSVPTAHRKCMENMLLFEYRLEVGQSTICNHGRFHPRWSRPTNREKGRMMRRLPRGEENPAGGPSLVPPSYTGHPCDQTWLGLPWSPPMPLERKGIVPPEPGVYRLLDAMKMVYFGESKLLDRRLKQHARDYRDQGVLVSWVVMADPLPYHLKERETDLIGAFYKKMRIPPRDQYRANR